MNKNDIMIKRNEGYANLKLKACRVIYSENESTTRYKVSKERKSKRWTKSTQASKLNIKERNVLEFLKVSDSCYQTFAVVLLLPGNPTPRTPPNPIPSRVNSF